MGLVASYVKRSAGFNFSLWCIGLVRHKNKHIDDRSDGFLSNVVTFISCLCAFHAILS